MMDVLGDRFPTRLHLVWYEVIFMNKQEIEDKVKSFEKTDDIGKLISRELADAASSVLYTFNTAIGPVIEKTIQKAQAEEKSRLIKWIDDFPTWALHNKPGVDNHTNYKYKEGEYTLLKQYQRLYKIQAKKPVPYNSFVSMARDRGISEDRAFLIYAAVKFNYEKLDGVLLSNMEYDIFTDEDAPIAANE
jgi:hypothetical protein